MIVFLNFSIETAKMLHCTNVAKDTDSETDCVSDFEINHYFFSALVSKSVVCMTQLVKICGSQWRHQITLRVGGLLVPLPPQPPLMCSPLTVSHLHGLQLGVWSPVEAFHLLLLQSFQ